VEKGCAPRSKLSPSVRLSRGLHRELRKSRKVSVVIRVKARRETVTRDHRPALSAEGGADWLQLPCREWSRAGCNWTCRSVARKLRLVGSVPGEGRPENTAQSLLEGIDGSEGRACLASWQRALYLLQRRCIQTVKAVFWDIAP
jgi:hypothetical protein